MHRGYVRLWRKSIDSGILQNADLWRFWCYCLMKATHQPTKVIFGFQSVDLEPGQLIFGRKKAANELTTTERKIRTCVEFLVKSKKVTIKTTNRFSIISIVDWHTYNSDKIEDDQQDDQQLTNKRPTNDHIQTHITHKAHKEKKDVARSYAKEHTSELAAPPVISIPLIPKDGEYQVFQKDIDEWMDTFPGIDVLVELKRIRLWNMDRPHKRKTANGVRRHITTWLSRAQDRPAISPSTNNNPTYQRLN